MNALQAENIDCAVHYPTPLNNQPIIKKLLKPGKYSNSEKLSKTILSLPMHPYLTDSDIANVIEAVEKVTSYYAK
jgi:dTDP-4-amino-4,6-dideoxygalactose transaminase